MREIKFRVYDKMLTKMIYDSCRWYLSFNDDGTVDSGHSCELMQFTGVTDAKGVDVYEGDIVIFSDSEFSSIPLVISFVGTSFCVVNPICCEVCKNGNGCVSSIDEVWCDMKIVGNIYEHPELLSTHTPLEKH